MARAALGLGVRELATLAKVSPNTIARLERGDRLYARTTEAVRGVLEEAGLIFLPGDDTVGPGVRLRASEVSTTDRGSGPE
nr:XRE family transcriptional regulator [Roseomonas sp. MO-31]